MIEFRWVRSGDIDLGSGEPKWKLQYRLLFAPHMIASGDIVLYAVGPHATWVDVPHVEREDDQKDKP